MMKADNRVMKSKNWVMGEFRDSEEIYFGA